MILPIIVVQCKMAPSILWCPLQANLSRLPMKRELFREKGDYSHLLIVGNEETNLNLVPHRPVHLPTWYLWVWSWPVYNELLQMERNQLQHQAFRDFCNHLFFSQAINRLSVKSFGCFWLLGVYFRHSLPVEQIHPLSHIQLHPFFVPPKKGGRVLHWRKEWGTYPTWGKGKNHRLTHTVFLVHIMWVFKET